MQGETDFERVAKHVEKLSVLLKKKFPTRNSNEVVEVMAALILLTEYHRRRYPDLIPQLEAFAKEYAAAHPGEDEPPEAPKPSAAKNGMAS